MHKEETNLVVVVFEVEVGTGELGLNDLPEPVHWRTKRDVRGIGWTRATGEEGNELAEGVDDDGPRVPAPGERTGVVVIGVDCCFHRIAAAQGEVTANMRLKSGQTTDRGERGEAAFYNVSHGVAFVVFVVGCAYLFGGENASELEETFGWIIKIGWRIYARVHQADELGGVDLRAWNMNS